MADDVVTQMVNDPDFGKLSPAEQRKALSAHDPVFSKVSDDEITKFISAHHAAAQPPVNPQGGIPGLSGARPGESDLERQNRLMTAALSGQKGMLSPEESSEMERGKQAGYGAAIATAGSGGAPTLAEGVKGLGGVALRTLLSGAGAAPGVAAGQQNPTPESVAKESAGYALAQPVAEGISGLGGYLSSKAAPALARILRLSPKAFQFGREPAQEVLERGLVKGSLPEIQSSIQEASKEVTSNLNTALKNTKGTVNVENAALDVANQLPGTSGARFLKVVDDAAAKLGLRTNQLSSLSAADANALKQEVAKQAKFVEGDLRPSVANGGKVFGGRMKDELVKLNPDVKDLLESSANLTEASKGADYAVRAEKAGQGKGPLGGVQVNKPATYARVVTDKPNALQTLYSIANGLKDHTSVSNALRVAFSLAYPSSGGSAGE